MIASAQRTVIVADGTKLGNISVAKIVDLSEIDQLITGPSAPLEVVEELASKGVSVEIAEPEPRATTGADRPGDKRRNDND